ncbi:MAG: hypothetical protein KAS23_07490 [Anaerohalosphaera sp.]|nr:hypothetical protein [Anaerohalosphaera sp.]
MHDQKPEKHPIRFWLIIGAIIVTPIATLILYRMRCQSEFDRRVEALREQGFPVSTEDLEKTYILDEGVENAADVYILAFQYQQKPTANEIPYLPRSGSYRWSEDEPPYPQKVINAFKSHTQRNQTTFDLLEQASQTEHCLWPRTNNNGYISNDYLSEIKRAMELLTERNYYLAQTGDGEELFNSIQTSIALSKTLSKQPFLIDHLVTISLKAMIASCLEDVLPMAEFSELQLLMLQKQFAVLQDTKAYRQALINDRCITIAFWQLPPAEQQVSIGGPSKPAQILYSTSGLKQKDALLSLDNMEIEIQASQLPLHQRYEELKRIEEELNTGILSFMHLYLNYMTSPTMIAKLDLRLLANLKCAETAMAIERYRKKHNALPDFLVDLVPRFMEELPRDPFDNKTLRYFILDNSYTIYSIGDDLVDNNGLSRQQLKDQTGKSPKQYDWPFTVKW